MHDANQGFVNATTVSLNGGTGFLDGGVGFSYMQGDTFTYFIPGQTQAARVEYGISITAAPEPGTLVLIIFPAIAAPLRAGVVLLRRTA